MYNNVMLDKQTNTLLRILSRICADGSYKVIEISDLIKQMQPKYIVSETALDQMFKFLSSEEMIDIKYKDEKVYCVSVSPHGRVIAESGTRVEYDVKPSKFLAVFTIIGSFAAAFMGALIACLIVGH